VSFSIDGLYLPPGLVWVNKYDWNPVGQSVSVALSGALIIQEAVQLQGRPIKLRGGPKDCWCEKSLIDQLYTKLDSADLEMTLNLNSDGSHTVIWDRNSPMKVSPILPCEFETSDSLYYIEELNLIKVG